MPELPEVETVRRTLEKHLLDRTVSGAEVHETRMRYPVDREALVERTRDGKVQGIRRRAKYLLFDLSNGNTVLLHLGMSGRVKIVSSDAPRVTHDHVGLRLCNGQELRFNDPRRFGWIDAYPRETEETHPRLVHLGVEPLSSEFTASRMIDASANSKRPVKNFIMDGTKVVGVGNIYASEALFLAKIHPKRAAGRISAARWGRLVEAIREVLSDAIENGGTTLRDFVDAEGTSGGYGGRLRVYGRENESCPCDEDGIIKRSVMVGRSTYYCNRCQR